MPESFAASEELGFVALTLRTGGDVWLAAASIYAVEKVRGENFTIVKTVGEALGVDQSPREVFEAIERAQNNNAERAETKSISRFVEFVSENKIEVWAHKDEPAHLLESDKSLQMLELTGYPINREGDPVEVDADKLTDEELSAHLRDQGLDDTTIGQLIDRRREARIDESIEREFGEDLASVMERIRRRDEEAGNA